MMHRINELLGYYIYDFILRLDCALKVLIDFPWSHFLALALLAAAGALLLLIFEVCRWRLDTVSLNVEHVLLVAHILFDAFTICLLI